MYGVDERMSWTAELRRAERRRECRSGRWLVVSTRTLEAKTKVGTMGTPALGRGVESGKNE
jgi:hypothetical protein